MEMITLDQVMSWEPCYSREQIEDLAAGRTSMSPIEIADLSEVRLSDRLWLLLRPEIIPETLLHGLACNLAERVLLREREAGREPDARSWRVLEVKRAWLRGEATLEELDAACDAAWAAVRDVRDAAWDTAWATAWAAAMAVRDAASAVRATDRDARAAAWASAWAAARAARAADRDVRDTDRAAAWDAAWAAEQEWQLEQVRSILRQL